MAFGAAAFLLLTSTLWTVGRRRTFDRIVRAVGVAALAVGALGTLYHLIAFARHLGQLPPELAARLLAVYEQGEHIPLGPGDKLVIPAGAVHAEGTVTERMVYIFGISRPENLFDALLPLREPETSPLHQG